MCVRIFHHQRRDLFKKKLVEKSAQFYASFHPGVKLPQSFSNSELRRRPQEEGGGNALYVFANRQ